MSDLDRFVNRLVDNLFTKETARLTTTEEAILTENQNLTGSVGFLFQGVRYGERDLVKRAVSNLGIDPSLVPRMYAYAADRTQILQDMRKAKIALQMVCKGCMTLQDYRDALPNEMIEHVQGLKDYSRTRPEAYHLMSDPMKMQHYPKLREIIAIYTVSKLLY